MNIKQTSMHVIDKRNYHVYTIEIKGKNFKTSYKKNMCVCVCENQACVRVFKSQQEVKEANMPCRQHSLSMPSF